MFGAGGNDVLSGGAAQDRLHGGDGDDTLKGESGDDVLFGGGGADDMQGGEGDDTLVGGTGADTMQGGDGHDLFLVGEGLGDDSVFGGGGGSTWTDVIQLEASDGDLGEFGVDWTVTLDTGGIAATSDDAIELTEGSDGVISLADGTQITFQDIDRIQF